MLFLFHANLLMLILNYNSESVYSRSATMKACRFIICFCDFHLPAVGCMCRTWRLPQNMLTESH